MKQINLKIISCSQCPYFKKENVLNNNQYDILFVCRKDSIGIVYEKNINCLNSPYEVVPNWCSLEEFKDV